MMWLNKFIKEAKEINQQCDDLIVACEQSESDYEQIKKEVEYLAQTTTMSNSEALGYVMDKLREDYCYRTTLRRTPKNTSDAFKNIMNKLKENNNMFDISNIKIGDYVRMVNGDEVGYICDIGDYKFYICLPSHEHYGFDYTVAKTHCVTKEQLEYCLKQIFKQIGTYKFDEKDVCNTKTVKKLESYRNSNLSQDGVNAIMVNKINEIIDKLNAMS